MSGWHSSEALGRVKVRFERDEIDVAVSHETLQIGLAGSCGYVTIVARNECTMQTDGATDVEREGQILC